MTLPPQTINKAPTGYFCHLYSFGDTVAHELTEIKEYHGRIAEWKLTVVQGAATFGVSQGKDFNDALNNLALTSRDSTSDPDYLAVKMSAGGSKLLLEVFYYEDEL